MPFPFYPFSPPPLDPAAHPPAHPPLAWSPRGSPCQVEDHAAKAHDVMALRCRGLDTVLNYVAESYAELMPLLVPQQGHRPLHRVGGAVMVRAGGVACRGRG